MCIIFRLQFPQNFQKNQQIMTIIWRVTIDFTELERKKTSDLLDKSFQKRPLCFGG